MSDHAASVPVSLPEESTLVSPQPSLEGHGLCLSGGGFRAMLYHAGALWRLNEMGLLWDLSRISSVSGGSITAGWLACQITKRGWNGQVSREEFRDQFVEPLKNLARKSVDVPCVLRGMLPWCNVGREVAAVYDKTLFGGLKLKDLKDSPRFVFNASNLQTGAVWRFSKPYMGDYHTGLVHDPDVPLSWAVAASSAFPPVLSPFELKLKHEQFTATDGADLCKPPYTTRPKLSDGGVYDNMGLETVFKSHGTVFVSDGGAPFQPDPRPATFWPLQLKRVLDCEDNQVRALRRSQLIDAYKTGVRRGAYWSIGTPLSKYNQPGSIPCSAEETKRLAEVGTRLSPFDLELQEKLINWGYLSCAASLASNFAHATPSPQLPYPNRPPG